MEIRIGEKMSEATDLSRIFVYGRDFYESEQAFALRRPLDSGRLLYAKLRVALSDDINVEVLWNHFDNVVTALVWGAGFEHETSFRDGPMARPDKVAYIDSIVDGAVALCQK